MSRKLKRRLGFESMEQRQLMSATPIEWEAEAMQNVSGFHTKADPNASGGKYIQNSTRNNGELRQPLTVELSGNYQLTLTVLAPSIDKNSLYVQMDNGPKELWAFNPDASGYKQVSLPHLYEGLTRGNHVFKVFGAENGTRLDKFRLAMVGDSTDPPTDPPTDPHNPPPTGTVYTSQYKITNPANGSTIDLHGKIFLGLQNNYPNNFNWPDPVTMGHKDKVDHSLYPEVANQYPLTVKGTGSNFNIRGGVVQGVFDPLHVAPWHVWKNLADGDGLRVEGSGNIDVGSIRIDNTEDGFSPHSANGADKATDVANYKLHDAYFTNVRDDMVENDATRSITISDSFMSGHTFYSSRGTANPNAVVNINNMLVELKLAPHEGRISGTSGKLAINEPGGYPYPDGLGTGSILKLDSAGKNGKITISNSIFLIPRLPSSSNEDLILPDVTWQNVTIVWLGEGNYPSKLPAGVTLTRDRSVFDNAKAAFFASHPQYKEGTLQNN